MVGALTPVGTFVTNYRIYPFVGLIEPGFAWVAQEAEVAEVLEFRIEDLAAGHSMKRLVRRGIAFKTDVYEVDGHMVWGATARILADLLAGQKPLDRGRSAGEPRLVERVAVEHLQRDLPRLRAGAGDRLALGQHPS